MLWNHCNPAALRYLFTNTLRIKQIPEFQLYCVCHDTNQGGISGGNYELVRHFHQQSIHCWWEFWAVCNFQQIHLMGTNIAQSILIGMKYTMYNDKNTKYSALYFHLL